ncbi:CoA-acylating methylmalonate-semialdehyde dehydrogenase [Opitutus sp. GAS368]|uniref:CoA-acylating methylmalonate-semialdehyde dehydrogenase n=1 Tax=Opitutus sp. GAS368 TaxID=1882749 RepID=UPI00087DEF8F|nr:CoA-acylating methylmalonate-semialdehyde dehydrogenase [Opitutus sp. GAS368]SDS18107.1 methylmalonate-semialdehyde dehydrogenase [acylating] [Opitutus sp. GAS368]
MTHPTSFQHPFYIDGEWTTFAGAPRSPVFNPSLGEVLGELPLGGAAEVDSAVRAAHAAFPAWADTPAVERARVMFKYRTLIEQHFDEIARLICREHGKTYAEARGDLFRGYEVVELACAAPTLLTGELLPNIARGIDGELARHPLGVCAGITPFNFPAMIPLWMFPLALVCGNTFVLKPSERVPLTAIRLTQLLAEAGLPKGVFNLVHGGRDAVDALLKHPLVKAVSFVGSTPVARHVYTTGTAHGKRVQANGGAKNYVVVMPDADIGKTVEGIMNAAFGCAGERCMAGASMLTVGDRGGKLLPELVKAAQALTVGRTDVEKQPGMGAVITAAHRDRVRSLVDEGERAGARVVADGRSVKVTDAPNGFYLGATIVEDVRTEMKLAQEEVFGPVLNVLHMSDLDQAIALANQSSFGNGAAIFTRSGAAAREFKHRVSAGMIGINVGVPAPMSMFPFSGWNESFFGDLHMQGRAGVMFYTQPKVTTSRWFIDGEGDIWRK